MEALAERVRLVEGEVTRRREVLADNENVRLRLDAAEQQLSMGEQRAGERGPGAAAAGLGGGQMVDARRLNKPRTFTGLHSEWKTWSFDFEAYVFAVQPRLGDLLNQASRTAGVLTAQSKVGATLDTQLCYIPVSVTSDVAKVEVREAPRGDGLSAWWHLLREFAPKEANRFAAMVGRAVRCEFADPVMTNVAEFEQLARECADQRGDVISDNMKRGVIMSGNKSEKLADHLSLNASRLGIYEELEQELKTICAAQRRRAATGAGGDGVVPMQVDAIGRGKGGRRGNGKGKDSKGKSKGDSMGKKGDAKDKGRETRNCHYCGKAGHLAADYREKKADEKRVREVASLAESPKGQSSAATAASALQGNGAGSQASLAPAVDVSRVAAVLAQMQLQQQRGLACASSTVHIANINMAGRADIPTLEEYHWQVGMLYDRTQCDALPVAVGDAVEFDWALFDAGSGLITCPQEFADATEMLPPKILLRCVSTTGDAVKSMGTRIVAAESEGVPLHIEFQVPNVKRAIVGADTFTEGGRISILGKGPYILLTDGRNIRPCRGGKTFWLRTRRHLLTKKTHNLEQTPQRQGRCHLHPRHLLLGTPRVNLTKTVISVKDCDGHVRRDPKSKGAIQNANKMVEGMFRTLRASIESRCSAQLTLNHWIMGAVCEFGETVMCNIQNISHHKAENRWGKAIWVGKDNRAEEHLLTTAAGRKTARTVSGRVEDQRWSKNLFNKVECTPWGACAGPEEDAVKMPQQDGMGPGVSEMDFKGALAEAKRGPKQKVIAGLSVNMATAALALTRDAVPRDDVTDIAKQGLYDREDGKESVRSRFVATQFAWDVRDDTFAGTPPLAAFRLVVSVVSSLCFAGIGDDGMIALYDVSVAIFHAYIYDDIHVVMDKGGSTRIKVTVQVYYHKGGLLMVIVHGDGFLAGFRIQHDRKRVKVLVSTILNRKVGVSSSTKRSITPASKTIGKDCRESPDELSTEYATTDRGMAPAALCVVHGRLDIQQAVGIRHRLASYLEQHPQFELFFEFQRMPMVIAAEVDSDWASERGRRSVDGGFLFIGSHMIEGWSGQQGNRALSSAEAEVTGVVNGSARGIWSRNVMLEMGFEMTLQTHSGFVGDMSSAPVLSGAAVRDRHCEQGRQPGYTIADDVPFSRILDHATAQEREYRAREAEAKTVCHWGQRKLMLAEVEFLTKYYDEARTVVYAGAAPGTHMVCLADLFPKLKFVLVDPRPFSSHLVKAQGRLLVEGTEEPRIEIREGFFTDEMAKEFSQCAGVLFISDVRTSDDHDVGIQGAGSRAGKRASNPRSVEPEGPPPAASSALASVLYPSQQYVQGDMERQQSWHRLMRPVASSFKFRLPWDDGTTTYLSGDIHLPVWGGPTTTECRLFVETRGQGEGDGAVEGLGGGTGTATYDNRRFERQMFYFNTHRRIARYKHDFIEFYKCCCFDCTSEATILMAYLGVVRKATADLANGVAELSMRLDKECHRDYQHPRTLFDPNPDPVERKQRILKRQKRR
ncbi:unnamed protein product [Prorocentrum cordatum]|uniref:Cap-specific mRNA (nucleoside-2'-O-)-methyltransferase n=1 Tax=Prorocentrum cordatum TaxID=2364126 RepID=A0ABN9V3E0_9DINO|nr:unnamed protein product [Polarella glacialis]